MYYGVIYKITNKINGKVYIGQTTQKLEYRWRQHYNEKRGGCVHLFYALQKHGKENFIVEKIDYATDSNSLAEKEIYWIKYYNSANKGFWI